MVQPDRPAALVCLLCICERFMSIRIADGVHQVSVHEPAERKPPWLVVQLQQHAVPVSLDWS